MTGIKPAAGASKASPAYFLFIILFLVSIVSIYIQEKLLQLQSHHSASTSSINFAITTRQKKTPGALSISSSRKLSSSSAADEPNNEILYPKDSIGSAKILLAAAQTTPRPILDSIIDHDVERARCTRYKLNYTPNKTNTRRRIFWGANIADDSWHILSIQAIETYGLFHTVAFVESNRTSMADERQLRFDNGSLNKEILMGGMFGDSKVSVDCYVNEDVGEGFDTLVSLEREHAQRALIIERWKKNGMTKHDIGFLSDTDELFSRDFLRAMQICDVPQFISSGKGGHNHCAAPKVYGLVTIFEGSPECVSAEEIYHPALMIGECIEGIGDQDSNDLYPKPTRDGNLTTQWRTADYSFDTYFSALHDKDNPPPPRTLPKNVYFPLWNAADFRRNQGGYFYGDDNLPLYIGYHVHNFFDDMSVLRKKYKTYGHAIGDALTKPLSAMNREVNLMIRCAKHNNTYELEGSVIHKYKSNDERRKAPIYMRKGGIDFLRKANHGKETGIGAIPLAFRIEEYLVARQKELVKGVEKDERERLEVIAKIRSEEK